MLPVEGKEVLVTGFLTKVEGFLLVLLRLGTFVNLSRSDLSIEGLVMDFILEGYYRNQPKGFKVKGATNIVSQSLLVKPNRPIV